MRECATCGTPVPRAARYCAECGRPVEGGEEVPDPLVRGASRRQALVPPALAAGAVAAAGVFLALGWLALALAALLVGVLAVAVVATRSTGGGSDPVAAVRERAAVAGDTVAARSREQVALFRARRELARLENERARLFAELGRAVYEGTEPAVPTVRAALDDVGAHVAAKEAEIEALKRETDGRIAAAQASVRPTERVQSAPAARSAVERGAAPGTGDTEARDAAPPPPGTSGFHAGPEPEATLGTGTPPAP